MLVQRLVLKDYLKLLLRKGACSICDALDSGYPLYYGLVGHPWPRIRLSELKGCSRFVYCEVVLCREV